MKKVVYSNVTRLGQGGRITIPPIILKKLNITDFVRKEYRAGEDFIRIYKGDLNGEKLSK